jgi:hypothetical protein
MQPSGGHPERFGQTRGPQCHEPAIPSQLWESTTLPPYGDNDPAYQGYDWVQLVSSLNGLAIGIPGSHGAGQKLTLMSPGGSAFYQAWMFQS